MKLRQLQCLCAVVDAGFNISRASEALYATQPAVGKQLRQLEEEFGTELLVRQGGRLVGLTDAGERALVWARRTLQNTENLRAAVRQSDESGAGTLQLATSHTLARYVLLPAIQAFTKRFPMVNIAVQQGAPDQVAELVREGKVAIGIIHMPPQLAPEVLAVPFLQSRQVLAVPEGHPLLQEEELTLEKLAGYRLIVQSPSRPQGARILNRFHQAGLQVNLSVQALDADVMKTYVAAGLGISIIPAFSFSEQHDTNLRVREIGHLFSPAVSALLLRRRSYLRPFTYAFVEQLEPTLDRPRVEALVFEEE